MSVNIHGKEYITVAERVQEAGKDFLELNTEVLFHSPVVVKATVKTTKGTFTGISAANPAKSIEKMSPYEVAETSAVGRALGFAGYGVVEGIATADEMNKSEDAPWVKETKTGVFASDKQLNFIRRLLTQKGQKLSDLLLKYKIPGLAELPMVEASQIIDNLTKLPDAVDIPGSGE